MNKHANKPKTAYVFLLFMDLEVPMVLGMKHIQHKNILSCTGFMISKLLVIWHFNKNMAENFHYNCLGWLRFCSGITIILSIPEADEHPI